MASMSNLDNYVDHDIYQRYSDERPWMEVVGHHKSEDHSNQKVSTTMLATVQESRSYNFRRKPINFLESPWIFRHSPKDLGDYPGRNLNIPHLSGKNRIIHQPLVSLFSKFTCKKSGLAIWSSHSLPRFTSWHPLPGSRWELQLVGLMVDKDISLPWVMARSRGELQCLQMSGIKTNKNISFTWPTTLKRLKLSSLFSGAETVLK